MALRFGLTRPADPGLRAGHVAVSMRRWAVWGLPGPLRTYIVTVVAADLAAALAAGMVTRWRGSDLLVFFALIAGGTIAIAATRKVKVAHGGLFRDMRAAWYIATAVLLPPFYALVIPIPLMVVMLRWMRPGVTHRRVFTAAANGLSYAAAGLVFHAFPPAFAGHMPGPGLHALAWTAILGLCGALGLTLNNAFVIGAVGLSSPGTSLREMALSREAVFGDLVQLSYAFAITLPTAISPLLLPATLPLVLVQRRLMMHTQLQAAARFDSKTGLLNATTWQQEAQIEVSRAARTRTPLAVAMIDIDHFKLVNDTYGHLTGDAVLSALSAAMRALLREYDLVGRFGGEEFCVLLPHTTEGAAYEIAERLRERLSQITVTTSHKGTPEVPVQVTVSIGVACLHQSRRDLDDLIAAADAALYYAKETGRNQVKMAMDGASGEQP